MFLCQILSLAVRENVNEIQIAVLDIFVRTTNALRSQTLVTPHLAGLIQSAWSQDLGIQSVDVSLIMFQSQTQSLGVVESVKGILTVAEEKSVRTTSVFLDQTPVIQHHVDPTLSVLLTDWEIQSVHAYQVSHHSLIPLLDVRRLRQELHHQIHVSPALVVQTQDVRSTDLAILYVNVSLDMFLCLILFKDARKSQIPAIQTLVDQMQIVFPQGALQLVSVRLDSKGILLYPAKKGNVSMIMNVHKVWPASISIAVTLALVHVDKMLTVKFVITVQYVHVLRDSEEIL